MYKKKEKCTRKKNVNVKKKKYTQKKGKMYK